MSSAYSRYIDCSPPPCTYHYGNGHVPPSLYHWPSHGWDGYYSRPQQHCIPYDHTAYHYYSRPTFHEYYDPPNSQFNYPPMNMPYIHYGYRPVHPAEQFRHPDDYPVHPNYHHYYPSELHYPQRHCCGCPNHVCHSGPLHSEEKNQVAVKNNRPTIVDDEGARDMVKNGSECGKKIQQISPGIWFMPYDGQTPGTESQKKKDESPTYWIPLKDADSSNAKSGVDSIPNISFVPQDFKFNNQGMVPPNPRFQEIDNDKNDSCPKIIFIPSNFVSKDETKRTSPGELEEKEKLKDAEGMKSIKEENEKVKMESYGNIRNIPVKVKDAEEERGKEKDGMESIKEENGKVKEERSGNIIREIPVKQVEDKKMSDSTKGCKLDHSKENGDPKGSKKSSPSSSPRASKLPPVCLRVDPLPSKKRWTNGNGKSSTRSPSPPHKNEVCSVPQINYDGNGEKEELKEMKANPYSRANSELKEVKTKPSIQANSSLKFEESVKGVADVVTNKRGAEGSDNRGVTKRKFSEEEAAMTIKAAYRGYLVRKLHPLKKLREINKIKLRVREIEQKISCPSFKEELVTDSKVKVGTHELIMSLLLQLDTIQGLHPDVREVRKSVARELTRLQESLDMLVDQATANQENQADMKSQILDASAEEAPGTATTFERTDMPTQPVMLLNDATIVEKRSNLENMMSAAEANGAKLNNETKRGNDMEAEALEGRQSMLAVSEETNAGGDLCNVFIEEEQAKEIVEKGSNLENMSAAEANGAKLNNETKGGNDMEAEGLEGRQSMLAVSEEINAVGDLCNVFIEEKQANVIVQKGSNLENMSAAEVNGAKLNNETKGGNDMEAEALEGCQSMLAVSEETNAAGDLCNVFIEEEQAKEIDEKGSNLENMMSVAEENMMSAAEVNGAKLNNETKCGNDMEAEALEGCQSMLAVPKETNAEGDLCNVFIEDEQANEKTLWPENGYEEQDAHEDIVSAFEENQADVKTDREEKCPVPNDEIEKEALSIDTIVSLPTESDQDKDSKVQDSSFPRVQEDARTSIEISDVRMSEPEELQTEGFEEVKTSESEVPATKSMKAEDTLKEEDSSINIHISELSGLDSINNDGQNEMSKPQIRDKTTEREKEVTNNDLVLAQDMEEIPLGFGSEETFKEESAEICKNRSSQFLSHELEEDNVDHLMDPKAMLKDGNEICKNRLSQFLSHELEEDNVDHLMDPKTMLKDGHPTEEEWEEENLKNSRLKKMVEELLEAGKQQLFTIEQLRDKVRMLENKLNEEKPIIRRKPKTARKKAKHVILNKKTCSPGLGA